MEANKLMRGLIESFPTQLKEAMEIANNSSFGKSEKEYKNVVICGMGGSGIGGLIVSQWLDNELKVPVIFCQDYNLPNFVDENSLVIGSSYSGNTEETLIALDKAITKGARIIGITSGGKLKEICHQNNFDFVIVPGGNPPRASMGYSIVQLVNVFGQLGMCSTDRLNDIQKGIDLIIDQQDEIQSLAKDYAMALKDKVTIFYSSARHSGLTVRARQQFNENSKKISHAHFLPEMNHNELLGWTGGDSRFAVVFFDTKDLVERNQKRVDITLETIRKKTDTVITIEAKGNSKIEKSIYLNNIIDWTSFLIADMNGVDSVEIDIIDYLKDSLSKI